VVAPVATGMNPNETFNVNGDTAAGAIAGALKADRLLLLTDVSGVKNKAGEIVTQMTPDEVRAMIADGTIAGGMIPKTETALAAVEDGVRAVVILDGRIPNACLLELFTDQGAGSLIRSTEPRVKAARLTCSQVSAPYLARAAGGRMDHELIIRLGVFLGLFAVLRRAGNTGAAPRPGAAARAPLGHQPVDHRAEHAGLAGAGGGLAAACGRGGAGCAGEGWGLFNRLGWPLWLEMVLAVLVLDFAIWAQHLVTHKVPLLWRFHRMHHADRDMDVTTALRFHPVEIAASMGLKIGLVYLLGPRPGGAGVRGDAERHGNVQPCQPAAAALGWTGWCGWCW
jgi:hypothetical protein